MFISKDGGDNPLLVCVRNLLEWIFIAFFFFLSGLLLTSNDEGRNFEFNVRLSGRYGYLHFYSDAAYTMRGFNISYRYAMRTCGCMQIC